MEDMYMKARLALPVNSNPGMVFPRQHFETQRQQLRYGSRLHNRRTRIQPQRFTYLYFYFYNYLE